VNADRRADVLGALAIAHVTGATREPCFTDDTPPDCVPEALPKDLYRYTGGRRRRERWEAETGEEPWQGDRLLLLTFSERHDANDDALKWTQQQKIADVARQVGLARHKAPATLGVTGTRIESQPATRKKSNHSLKQNLRYHRGQHNKEAIVSLGRQSRHRVVADLIGVAQSGMCRVEVSGETVYCALGEAALIAAVGPANTWRPGVLSRERDATGTTTRGETRLARGHSGLSSARPCCAIFAKA